MNPFSRLRQAYDDMPHRRRQYLNLGAVAVAGTGALWIVFSIGETQPIADRATKAATAPPTNLGIQVPGEIDPREAWLGTAGREVAQLKADVETQQRKEGERRSTEVALMKRLAELEQRASAGSTPPVSTVQAAPIAPTQPPAPSASTGSQPANYPPDSPMTTPVARSTMPTLGVEARTSGPVEVESPIVRISLAPASGKAAPRATVSDSQPNSAGETSETAAQTYLPVSFTSGVLLGGIDAPTGGQAQSNPLPILLRLTDNAVLPNVRKSRIVLSLPRAGAISVRSAFMRAQSPCHACATTAPRWKCRSRAICMERMASWAYAAAS
jgi:conjugal transfer pilus assembly protein TraB